jgi:hypothetical protein
MYARAVEQKNASLLPFMLFKKSVAAPETLLLLQFLVTTLHETGFGCEI